MPKLRPLLLMGTRPEWVASAFAVAMAGGVVVPINTYFERPELEHVLRHSDSAVLLTQERLLSHAYLDQVEALRPELPFLRLVIGLGVESHARPAAFQMAQDQFPGDPKQVSGKRPAFRVVTAILAQQGHKDLLCHVLRHRHRPAHVQREAEQARLPPPVEGQKRLFVPALHAKQEFVVRLDGQVYRGQEGELEDDITLLTLRRVT